MEFKDRLRHLRTLRGMTQTELDEASGVPAGSVAQWEQGRDPSLGNLMKLADGLRMTPGNLLPKRMTEAFTCDRCGGHGILWREIKGSVLRGGPES